MTGRGRPSLPEILAGSACLAAAAWFSLGTAWRLFTFRMGLDWAVIADAVHHTSRGRFFASAMRGLKDYSFWQEHISPVLLLYVPFYRLDGRLGDVVLATSQAAAFVLAGWLLFLVARRWLESGWAGLAAALFFLANGRVQAALVNDYHMLTLLPLFLFLSLWGAAAGKDRWLWAGFAGGLLLREDAFLALSAVPLCLLVVERRWRPATAMIAVAAAYEALLFAYAFPRLGAYRFFSHYAWLAPTPGALLVRLVTEPAAVLAAFLGERDNAPLLVFLTEYFWLPLLSPGGWAAGLFAMSESLLSNVGRLTAYAYHYVVPPAAALTAGTLLTLRFWSARLGRRLPAAAILAALALFHLAAGARQGAMPWSPLMRPPASPLSAATWREARETADLFRLVPPGARTEMTINLFGRFHTRPGARPYKRPGAVRHRTRFLLLDLETHARPLPPLDPLRLVRSGEWSVRAAAGTTVLLERGHPRGPAVVPVKFLDPLAVPTRTGIRNRDGRLTAPAGGAGWLLFGPHLDLPAGRYRFTIGLRAEGAGEAGRVEVTSDSGARVWARRPVPAKRNASADETFILEEVFPGAVRGVEVRVYSTGAVPLAFTGGRIDAVVGSGVTSR